MRTIGCTAFLLSLAALPAQRTWTVDLLNRPGTDFLDLPAAVAAAAPGDVLRVRWVDPALWQYYLLPTITRGLTILGDGAGPHCMGALQVLGLPQGEQVVISRIKIGVDIHVIAPATGMVIRDCRGTVVLNNCLCGNWASSLSPVGYYVERSVMFWMRNCTFEQGINYYFTLQDSLLIAEGTSFLPDPFLGVVVNCARSDIWLVDSVVQGAPPGLSLPYGGWAIASCNSTFHLAGNSRVVSGDPLRASAIGAWSPCPGFFNNVFLDPRAQVNVVNGTIINTPVPAQMFTLDTQRTTLTTTTYGHANCLAVQAWALAPTAPQPSPIGTLFLDPLACFVVDVGLLDASGRRLRSYPIPPGLPPQLTLALQSIQLTPSGALQLGNVSLPNLW